MDDRTYYRKSSGVPYRMVSRGGGRIELVSQDSHEHAISIDDAVLDAEFSLEAPGPIPTVRSLSGGDVVAIGVGKDVVKERRGLIPGLAGAIEEGGGRGYSVGGGLLGRCSICGEVRCEHILGEADALRVEKVVRTAWGSWEVVFGDGSWITILSGEGGEDPCISPYGRGKGGVVSEQARIRALAAVRNCVSGEGAWLVDDSGKGRLELVGAPGGSVKGVDECDDGNVKVRAFYEEAVRTADLGAALRGEPPWGGLGVPKAMLEGGSATDNTIRSTLEAGGRIEVFVNEPWRRKEDGSWEPGLVKDKDMEESNVKVSGRLLDGYHVNGVSVDDGGKGWVVEFEDESRVLVRRDESSEGAWRLACEAIDPEEMLDGQGRWARKAVRAFVELKPLVQAVSVGRSAEKPREWTVLFPTGMRVRVSEKNGNLFASQDDIEEWLEYADDESDEDEVGKWRDRAIEAVRQWCNKHDGVKLPVDNEWEEWPDPRTGSVKARDLDRAMKDREALLERLKGWYGFELPTEHNKMYRTEKTVVCDANGVELLVGKDYQVHWVMHAYCLYLSPGYVEGNGGKKVRVTRNGDVLHEVSIPYVAPNPFGVKVEPIDFSNEEAIRDPLGAVKLMEKRRPQVSAIHQLGGGYAVESGNKRQFPIGKQDWAVHFHDGTVARVVEFQGDSGSLVRCTDNLGDLEWVAEAVVKDEIKQISENVSFTKRGLGFEVKIAFGKDARLYEWAWTRPTLPPVEGEQEDWQCLTESDPNDVSGWRERSLLLLKRWLRGEYVVEDADREPGGPDNDVIVWTDRGPLRCHVHPDKDADGRGYVLVDVPEKHKDIRMRVEKAVETHRNKPSGEAEKAMAIAKDHVAAWDKERLEKLGLVEVDMKVLRGEYPVSAEPIDGRYQRVTIKTERGDVHVRLQRARVGDEDRIVAYDLEEWGGSWSWPGLGFRERVLDAIKKVIGPKDPRSFDEVKADAARNAIEWAEKVEEHRKANAPIDAPVGRRRTPDNAYDPEGPHVDTGERRCPHDGGACHHNCEDECYREEQGMSLTTPWEGYPLVPESWDVFDLDGANVGVPDAYNVYIDGLIMRMGRKHDYIFTKPKDRWVIALDPGVFGDKRVGVVRICHVQDGNERQVWLKKIIRHTKHCKARMEHGDGECECHRLDDHGNPQPLDIQEEFKPKYIKIPERIVPAATTMSVSCVFTPEAREKTKPTLEGLESRIDNLELSINELIERMDGEYECGEEDAEEEMEEEGDDYPIVMASIHERLAKLEAAIAQLDSRAFGRMENVAQMDGRVRGTEKGVAAHEEWLQRLERRFAMAALPDHTEGARALLDQILIDIKELKDTVASQKDLNSAQSKKIGELSNTLDETRSATIRHDRMIVDLGWQVSKILELLIHPEDQLKDLVEQPQSRNLIKKANDLFTWTNSLSRHLAEMEARQVELARRIGWKVNPIPSMFTLDGKPIKEELDVGTCVGFSGNTSMSGVVIDKRMGPDGPERCVEWQDMNGPAKGWHALGDLYDLDK